MSADTENGNHFCYVEADPDDGTPSHYRPCPESLCEADALAAALAAATAVEVELRREWWSNHGHDSYALYGDDGEMQCHLCPLDFKRAPLDEVREATLIARAALASRVPQPDREG